MDVMSELKPLGALFSSGEFHRGLEGVWALWARVPEPKVAVVNSYLILEYGVAFSLNCHDLDGAQRWASIAPDFVNVRHDSGEVEFLIGKVAFERGELDQARHWISIANGKSEGRMLEGQGKKYVELIR